MKQHTGKKNFLRGELLEKARRYCAYRERCTRETEEKLFNLGADPSQIKSLIKELEKEGFIDNMRFARVFAQGKFQNNQWGRNKIASELSMRNIPPENIDAALEQIDLSVYEQTLQQIIERKMQALKGETPYVAEGKTADHCIRKGYEPDLVWRLIKKKITKNT